VREKLGRNDPYWCGSGLKYKKCHMSREKQEPLKLWEASKEFRKAFSTKYCLAPEFMKPQCSGTIVKAHTVPKSGSLQKIAHNGHVYSFVPSLENLNKYGGKLQPELIGISKASAFTGFCTVHDNNIFSKIEKEPFLASQEQCFLLAYRALAREIYMKKAQVSSLDVLYKANRGKPLEQQLAIQDMKRLIEEGSSAGLRDCEYHKIIYDKVFLGRDFSSVHAYVIELKEPPPIMCSGGLFPEQDFCGNQLQDLLDLQTRPHFLSVSSFYGGQNGDVVFTWLSESDTTCRKFIDSLVNLPPQRLTDALIRFFFEGENLYVQPDWWDNLSESNRTALVNRLSDSGNINLPRKSGYIAEDGIQYDNWPIFRVKSIGFEQL